MSLTFRSRRQISTSSSGMRVQKLKQRGGDDESNPERRAPRGWTQRVKSRGERMRASQVRRGKKKPAARVELAAFRSLIVKV